MKYLIILGILVQGIVISQAQELHYNNSISFGSESGGENEVIDLAHDDLGNLYSLGYFSGVIDFDPGLKTRRGKTTFGEQKLYVAKFDSLHEVKMIRFIEYTGNVTPTAIDIDHLGNITIGGIFDESMTFNRGFRTKTITSKRSNRNDGFLAQYDSLGVLNWAFVLGNQNYDVLFDAKCDEKGNIYITGTIQDSVDMNPLGTAFQLKANTSGGNAYFAKYSSKGLLKWAYITDATSRGMKIELDSYGNIYYTGYYYSKMDVDPSSSTTTLTPIGGHDIFVVQHDTSGKFGWGISIGGKDRDWISDISYAKGRLFLTGNYYSKCDFDPSSTTQNLESNGLKDLFIACYDSLGNYHWAHSFGSNADDEGLGIEADSDGNCYVTGYYERRNLDWDPSSKKALTSSLDQDIFLVSYDSNGNFRWVNAIVSGRDEAGKTMALNGDEVRIVGGLGGSADFDPDPRKKYNLEKIGYSRTGFYAAYATKDGSLNNAWLNEQLVGSSQTVTSLEVDSFGNFYMGGYFDGSNIDIHPGKKDSALNHKNDFDIYIAKYDSDLQLKYAITLNGTQRDFLSDMVVDSLGNLYFCGTFQDTLLYLDSLGKKQRLTSTGERFRKAITNEIILGKINPQGKIEWLKGFGDIYDESVGSIALDKDGNLAITGSFEGWLDIDPDTNKYLLTSKGKRDIFVAKYNNKGELLWGQSFGDTQNDGGGGVAFGPNGAIHIAGSFEGTVDFNSSTATNALKSRVSEVDAFFAKYAPDGSFIWATHRGSDSGTGGGKLTVDSQGNVYSIGRFRGKLKLNPSTSNYLSNWGKIDAFIIKLDSNGRHQWLEAIQGHDYDYIHDFHLQGNKLVLAGSFSDSAYFNQGKQVLYGIKERDGFIITMDTNGRNMKSLALGGSYNGYTSSIVNLGNGVIAAGTFLNEIDLNPDPRFTHMDTAFGSNYVYVLKLGDAMPCDTIHDTISLRKCYPYNYPGTTEILSKSGRYKIIKQNPYSCDSVIHIEFSLLFDSLSKKISQCDSFLLPGRQKWVNKSGKYQDSLININGCDSLINYTIEIKNSTIRAVSIIACDSFYLSGRQLYITNSGNLIDSFKAANGCDSLINYQLNINKSHTVAISTLACDSLFLPGKRIYVTKSGLYIDSLKSKSGCDSINRISALIENRIVQTFNYTSCDSFIDTNSRVFYSDTSFTDSLKAAQGCDSIIHMNIIVNQSFDTLISVTSCDSFILPISKTIAYQSGIYNDSTLTSTGCQRIIKYDLTINPSKATVHYITVCDSFLSDRRGMIYSDLDYTDSFTSVRGCDSLVHWHIIVHQSITTTSNQTFCDRFYLPGQQKWVEQPGTYIDSFLNQYGCDSIIIYQLSKKLPYAGFQVFNDSLVADSIGYEKYQWYTCEEDTVAINGANSYWYKAKISGNFLLETGQNGCTSISSCKSVEVIGISNTKTAEPIVYPNPFQHEIRISLKRDTWFSIALYDMNGKRRIYQEINTNSARLNTSALPNGMYILMIRDTNGDYFAKKIERITNIAP